MIYTSLQPYKYLLQTSMLKNSQRKHAKGKQVMISVVSNINSSVDFQTPGKLLPLLNST